MNKPLKGVISKWHLVDNRVSGTCSVYVGDTSQNGITVGQIITTSAVVSIMKIHGATICETRNSRYILVD